MSDPQKPLPPGSRLRPAGGPPGAKGPRPARPAAPPPGPSASSMRLRKLLMLGIIFTCLALVGMIGWRLWQRMHPRELNSIDVAAEFDKAMDVGKGASKDIFSIQTKVWGQGKELTPEDFTTIKSKLAELRDCHDKLKDLLDIMHAQHKDESNEHAAIVPKWLQVKMWILDAADLLDNQKPPEYGGLNIPMFVTSEKIRKAQEELKEIRTTKDEVIKKGDPEEIKKTRKRISDLRDGFRSFSVKLQDLDKYVAEGLARPDLTDKDVIELGQLRDDANKATMAVKAAGTLLQEFPGE
jgi:hypothetical protein